MTTPTLTILQGPYTGPPINPIIDVPFKLDDFQQHAHQSIIQGNDLLISCPTSSGKTLIAEMGIINIVKQGKKAIMTTPIKCLSNEMYNNFKRKFAPHGLNVGIITGDTKLNPDAPILIVTNEILRNALYQTNPTSPTSPTSPETNIDIPNTGCVIIDEIHMFLDPDRGSCYEETVVLLPPHIQLIGLSATIHEPHTFATWIMRCRNRSISLVIATKRIVPLKHYIYHDHHLYEIMDNNYTYNPSQYQLAKRTHLKAKPKHNLLQEAIAHLKKQNLFQSIFFTLSKRRCEQYAALITDQLLTPEEQHEALSMFSRMTHSYQNIRQVEILRSLVSKGIAFHHSGLLPKLKEIIEIIFKANLIKVLFATETLAVGVNMPCHTVVFTDIQKTDGTGVSRLLTTSEYRQMSGRAGRRGLDTSGVAIILPLHSFPDEHDLRTILLGKIPHINSNFRWDYNFLLKIIQSSTTSLDDFFAKSLINQENSAKLNDLQRERNELTSLEYKQDPKLTKLLQLEQGQTLDGIKVTMNKKTKKEYEQLKAYAHSTLEIQQNYEIMKTNIQNEHKVEELNKHITHLQTYVTNNYNAMVNIMIDWNYIQFTESSTIMPTDITIKGITAAQINETNPIIMTEIIHNNLLDDLSPNEIVAMISIFTDPIKTNESKEPYVGTPLLRTKINILIGIIQNFVSIEEAHVGPHSGFADWTISTDYIDFALSWTNGVSAQTIIQQLVDHDECEGNFVRSMLRILNIIKDISSICKMVEKIDILPKLELIDSLVLRDIVSVDSIYVSS